MKYKTKQYIFMGSALLSLCLFVAMLFMVKFGYQFQMDKLNTYFYNHQSKFATNFFKFFTFFGEWWVLLLVGGLFTIYAKDKRIGTTCMTGTVVAVLLNLIFKFLVQRARPTTMLVSEVGYSFPSAHAMVSLAFYGLLIYFANRKFDNLACKIILTIVLSLIIALVGVSRIYLNVHYASDVLAGWLFGYVALYFGKQLGKLLFKFKPAKQLVNQT